MNLKYVIIIINKANNELQDPRQVNWDVDSPISGKGKDLHKSVVASYELQKLANESKLKSAKKKVNLASVRSGKQNETHIELLRLVETLVSYFKYTFNIN